MMHGLETRFSFVPVFLRLMLLLTAGLYSNHAFTQLKAAFSSDVTEGCAPLIVHFKDASTGTPTAYKWYLGNNVTPHIDKDPSTTYINPGTYTIRLVIRNATNTADSVEKSDYIRVYATPVVNFKASDSTGCYPSTIQFTDFSTPGDGTISKWLWDFGDGNTSTASNPAHEYTTRGNYNVTLRVTNSYGCEKTFSKIEYIRLQSGVIADFDFSAPNTCKAPTTVTFNNNSTGTGVLTYNWDFGDQGTSPGRSPTHTYTQAGSFSIRLITMNDAGCRDTVLKTSAINIGTVKADFSAPETICEGSVMQLKNTSEPGAFSSFWEFGDGTTSTSLHASKIYNRAGTFNIKLTSNFGSCTDVITKSVTVLPKPVAAFTASGNVSCQLPFTVTFSNQSQNGIGYLWQFGDGDSSTAAAPTHTYITSGRFNVTLSATGANGCTTSVTSFGFIRAEPLNIRLLNAPVKGCAPLSFKPQFSVNSTDAITSYEWNFGDGTTSGEASPAHIYLNTGSYTVKLIVTTAGGCTDSVVYKNAVAVGEKPRVSFDATPRETCAFTAVQFKENANDSTINEWFWEFGDGSSSTQKNPVHNYSDTGYFSVSLTVLNAGCKSELLIKDFIHILPPVAKFDIESNSCIDQYRRKFTNHSAGADSWNWDFGDGTQSSERDPEHVFTRQGVFKITLTVKNNQCEHSITRQVQIIDEKPTFSGSKMICRNDVASFTVADIDADHLNYVVWDYGDGSSQRIFSNTAKHAYQKNGTYDLKAIIYDLNGCTDTLISKQQVIVKGPLAAFSAGKNAICKDGTVTFEDLSSAYPGSPIRQWIWQYGDGVTDTLASLPFAHTYKAFGSFNVRLKVVDSIGCTDQLTKSGLVLISHPVAAFQSPDTLSCYNQNIRFLNQSSGSSLTHTWEFGDGMIQNGIFQPNHAYAAEGNFSVKLIVKDSYGCMDSLTRLNYVRIKNPVAAFTVNDSLATCPPLVTTFKNNSQQFIAYSWDFGDRTSSAIDNPTHFYNYPGEYTAKLIVTSRGGCKDTSEKKMVVRGPQGTFQYPDTLACVPATIAFKGSSKDDVTFIWDYNNGNTEFTTDSSVVYRYDAPGIYYPKMILVDPQGCKVSIAGTKPLELKGVQAKFGLNKEVLCDSGLIVLKDQSVAYEKIRSYRWTFGDGAVSTLQHAEHYYKSAGQYPVQLAVVTETGCKDTVDVLTKINVAMSPHITIAGAGEQCAPAYFHLNGDIITKDSTALSWNWNLGNGRKDTVRNPDWKSAQADSTSISAVATSGWGCSDTAYADLLVRPIPLVDAGMDTVVCLGNDYQLTAKGADVYRWVSPTAISCSDCPSPIIRPADNSRLYVEGVTKYGCKALDSLLIRVKKPFDISVSDADTLCLGKSIVLTARGAEVYNWTPSTGLSNPHFPNPVAIPAVSTIYQVVGADTHHCFYDTAYVPVTVYPYPVVNAGEDKSILVGSSTKLDGRISADVTSIRWSPATGLDCYNCIEPVAAPKQTTNYRVQVTNQGGCATSDELTVFVLCNQGNLFIPNTFSPNGDGNNDVFYPRGKGIYGVKSLKIFNRWGEMVFERYNFQANDISSGWNGKFKGKETGQDVYVYTIEIVCENNSVLSFKGNIALLR